MNIALVTAVIGGIDDFKSVPEQSIPATGFYYTDLLAKHTYLDHRRQALYFKTQMHEIIPEFDFYIWIDGKIQITSKDFIKSCVDQLGYNDFAILKHHERKCIYTEIDHILHCIKKGNTYLATRYAHRPLREEKNYWTSFVYPRNNGLNDCKIFIVRNNKKMNGIFNAWWRYIKNFNFFDQTTIQVLCWLGNVKIKNLVFEPGMYEDVPHKLLK